MANPRVLLLGGHGKVSMLLTSKLLARSWDIVSVVRNPDQSSEITALGAGHPGKVSVLVSSIEDVKSSSDAQKVLDEVKPDYVVWSAGAGGKGGSSRTYAIDRDAANAFSSAIIATPSIKKYLLVSAINTRRARASWWSDADWARIEHMNKNVLPHYYVAKMDADEHLTALAHKRNQSGDKDFQCIILRPGGLSDEPETGKVDLGKCGTMKMVPRGDVAEVASQLLARSDTRGWFDLIGGEVEVSDAVEAVVKGHVDCIEGEDTAAIYQRGP